MGIGYELFNGNLRTMQSVSLEIDSLSRKLEILTKKNSSRRSRVIVRNKLQKYINILQNEFKYVLVDFDNLEGYKIGTGLDTKNVPQKK